MRKDQEERARIKEDERDNHDSLEVLGFTKEPETQTVFLDRANKAQYRDWETDRKSVV